MTDDKALCRFLSDGIVRITQKMEQEAEETKNYVLKKYTFSMRRLEIDMEELQFTAAKQGYSSSYFRMFNLITDMIVRLDREEESFIVKKYMLSLENLQKAAENLYLEQEDDA